MNKRKYWQAVQEKICMNCVDNNGRGKCQINPSVDCGLRMHFPRIVETITSVRSDQLDDYVHALWSNVCADCKYQAMDGSCALRLQTECALDRYFPLVVEAIEGVHGRTPA